MNIFFEISGLNAYMLGLSLTQAEELEYEVNVIQLVDNRLANQISLDK